MALSKKHYNYRSFSKIIQIVKNVIISQNQVKTDKKLLKFCEKSSKIQYFNTWFVKNSSKVPQKFAVQSRCFCCRSLGISRLSSYNWNGKAVRCISLLKSKVWRFRFRRLCFWSIFSAYSEQIRIRFYIPPSTKKKDTEPPILPISEFDLAVLKAPV